MTDPSVRPAADYARELQDFIAGTAPVSSLRSLVGRDVLAGEPVPIGALFGADEKDWPWLRDLFQRHIDGGIVDASARVDVLVAAEPGESQPHLIKIAMDFRLPSRQALRLVIPLSSEEFLEPFDVLVSGRTVAIKLVPGIKGDEEHAVAVEEVDTRGLAIGLAAIRQVGRF